MGLTLSPSGVAKKHIFNVAGLALKHKNIMNNSKKYLESKAVIAADLYKESKITRPECLRHEVDLLIGEDSGPIQTELKTFYLISNITDKLKRTTEAKTLQDAKDYFMNLGYNVNDDCRVQDSYDGSLQYKNF